jgi:hypothetical protein
MTDGIIKQDKPAMCMLGTWSNAARDHKHIELCTVTASLPPNMTMLDPGGTVTIGACYPCLHVVDGLGACSPSIWCARQATLHICFFVCHMNGWHTVLSADLMMTTVLAASRCRCVFSQSCSLLPSVTRFMRSGRSSKTTTGQQACEHP